MAISRCGYPSVGTLPVPPGGRKPQRNRRRQTPMTVEALSAVTFATHDMARSVRFYLTLGFRLRYGGESARFSSFAAGTGSLNITAEAPQRSWTWWGRAIFHVDDVDALYDRAIAAGFKPHAPPRDAPWGERYFHLTDPDGHEISFARPLADSSDEPATDPAAPATPGG